MRKSLRQCLGEFLYLSGLDFQVLIPFKLGLHRHYVLGVADLALVNLLKILLKLIEVGPEALPLVLDLLKLLLGVHLRLEIVSFEELL